MDRVLIEQKLESLRRCVARVAAKCPAGIETLASDADLQDIVVLNLTRAVQLCVDLGAHLIAETELPAPETMGQTFDLLSQAGVLEHDLAERMKRAVGFRNLAVHQYQAIDWAIVHAICVRHLQDFRAFAQAVAARLL
ncbi:MAG: DUF86 domain-containing protein [Candidatus Competibacter sp.]|nr:DUF86 domain-containing protein [Candidatus Competibacter sp.]